MQKIIILILTTTYLAQLITMMMEDMRIIKFKLFLLPKDLERLAGRIFSKGRSSEMEFGVNPLHAAFGFPLSG